jgi:ADP-dependent NAD(P)H-hydrate dehydratase / NAD(P)H-hydrate epimerase
MVMRVCTVQEMRDCDRRAVEDYGLPESILMENAGHAVLEIARREFGIEGPRYRVLCGGGNNGGDGLVAARLLHSLGAEVSVALLADESAMGQTSRANLTAAVRSGLAVQRLESADDLYLGRPGDVVVDALLGTGLARGPEGLYRTVIERVNASALRVLAVDIPSGVSGDTGTTPGVAIRASCTVTFGLPKRGNLLPPGRELCGTLYVSYISFPPSLRQCIGDMATVPLAPLPPRPHESHKAMYGDVLFVAGSRSYLGAPLLASMSLLRAGGGYARLATPESVASALGNAAREVVMIPMQETVEGALALSNLERLCELGGRADMVVIGPGLSLHDESLELVRRLLAEVSADVLVDGDGISAIAHDPTCVRNRAWTTIITPHVGEMARMLGCGATEIEGDRVDGLRRACERFNAIVVLKGSSTLVGDTTGRISVNLSGNPGMATAGCGDVLAGTIAAMHGAGLDHRPACEVGAFIHGMAGDLAAEATGQDGIIASDVMEQLPHAIRLYRSRFSDLVHNHYGRISVI